MDRDAKELEKLGYKQELHRGVNDLMSIAFCFTAVAVVSALSGLFPSALKTGGPAVMMWSWIVGNLLTIVTGATLAEIASTFPSSGSVYYWSAVMAPKRYAPFLAYITGWLSMIGNAAAGAFYAMTFSYFITYVQVLFQQEPLSNTWQVLVAIFTMTLMCLLNLLKVEFQGYFNYLGAFWQIGATLAVIISLFVTCPSVPNQSISFSGIFTTFNNETGIESMIYVILVGMLSANYSSTGYDAAVHLAEETHDASRAVPKGIFYTVVGNLIVGVLYLLSVLYVAASNVPEFSASPIGVSHVFETCMGVSGGIALTLLITVNLFFSGLAITTVTIRTAYALARDGGFLFSDHVKRVESSTKVPQYAVLATWIICCLLLCLPLVNVTAFIAVTSVSTIGFQLSYVIPIFLRVTWYRAKFQTSEFHLGSYSLVSGWISLLFLMVTSVMFLVPTSWPLSPLTFNYTPVVLLVFGILAGGYWVLFARHHYHGPHMEEKHSY